MSEVVGVPPSTSVGATVKTLRGETSDPHIVVPEDFVAKPGKAFVPGVLIGEPLGTGLQVAGLLSSCQNWLLLHFWSRYAQRLTHRL